MVGTWLDKAHKIRLLVNNPTFISSSLPNANGSYWVFSSGISRRLRRVT